MDLHTILRFIGIVAALAVAGIVAFNLLTFTRAFALGPRPRGLLRAVAKELAACFVLLPAWPLWALVGAAYEARTRDRRRRAPIILLHGYAMNRTNWIWLGRALVRRGLGPAYGFSYSWLASADANARKLARFVDEIAAREGAERVDIVAHSMGGLVARYFIERLGGARRVRHLITIATPHRGTRWARLAIGRMRRDLHLGAELCERLGAGVPSVRYTSIWSRADNLVLPADSARLAAPKEPADAPPQTAVGSTRLDGRCVILDDVVFDDLGHLGLLVSPRVAAAVAERLAADDAGAAA